MEFSPTGHPENGPTRKISAHHFRAAINQLLLLVDVLHLYHKLNTITMNICLTQVKHILPHSPYLLAAGTLKHCTGDVAVHLALRNAKPTC